MKSSANLIVIRRIRYIDPSSRAEKEITLSISRTHSKKKASERLGLACCTLNIDVPGFIEREITGRDPMQAVAMALLHSELFIMTLAKKGNVLLEDGKQFKPSDDSVFFGNFRDEQQREFTK